VNESERLRLYEAAFSVQWRALQLGLIALSNERSGSIGGRAREAMLATLSANEMTRRVLEAWLGKVS